MNMKKLVLGMALFAAHGAVAMEMNLTDQLIRAVRDNEHEDVARLLKEGADVNGDLSAFRGWYPLVVAAGKGHEKIAELLLDSGADIDPNMKAGFCTTSSPLLFACKNGFAELAQLFLERGADPNFINGVQYTALHTAVKKGHLKIVKLLLDKGAVVDPEEDPEEEDPEIDGPTPLCVAVSINRKDIVELLIKHDADIKRGKAWLLAKAYANGNNEMINFLKKAGCIVAEIDPDALVAPSQNGNRRAVRLLLQTGISLEGKDTEYQAIPLIWATYNGHKDVCEMLLEAGADPHAQNKDGQSPLDCAYKKAQPIIIAILKRSKIELPADEDCVNQQRDYARLSEYVEIIDLFSNPISLKGMCLQKLRKLIKKGEIDVSSVPNLEEFGFEHVIVSADQAQTSQFLWEYLYSIPLKYLSFLNSSQ